MGDFNPVPGMTTSSGQIGSDPNLVAPGKRMLSSMTPNYSSERWQALFSESEVLEDARLSIPFFKTVLNVFSL